MVDFLCVHEELLDYSLDLSGIMEQTDLGSLDPNFVAQENCLLETFSVKWSFFHRAWFSFLHRSCNLLMSCRRTLMAHWMKWTGYVFAFVWCPLSPFFLVVYGAT